MKRNVRKCFATGVLSLLLLAASVPAFAKNSRTVALSHGAVLNGTNLAAGRYVVQWEAHSPQATVEFTQGHKVVLKTECKVEDRGKIYPLSSVLYDTASDGTTTISEIRLAGSSEVLIFTQ